MVIAASSTQLSIDLDQRVELPRYLLSNTPSPFDRLIEAPQIQFHSHRYIYMYIGEIGISESDGATDYRLSAGSIIRRR